MFKIIEYIFKFAVTRQYMAIILSINWAVLLSFRYENIDINRSLF